MNTTTTCCCQPLLISQQHQLFTSASQSENVHSIIRSTLLHGKLESKKLEFFCSSRANIHPTRNQNSSFEIPKMPQHVLTSRHNVCLLHVMCAYFLDLVDTTHALWILRTQRLLSASQLVAPILIFVVECDSRRLCS